MTVLIAAAAFVFGFIVGDRIQRKCVRLELERLRKDVETSVSITDGEKSGCMMAIGIARNFHSVRK